MKPRFSLLAAGILGATGVALGAFGAHALEPSLIARGTLHAWETAARYHLIHAIALLAGAAGEGYSHGNALRWAARFWVIGVVLFSGSLYLLALGGPRWLGPITPLGGLTLLAGWVSVALAAWAKET